TRLGVLGWQAGDLSVADHLLPRIERLADSGDPLAMAVVELGAAVIAETTGDHAEMRSRLTAFQALEVAEPLRTMGHRFLASVDLQYGSPAAARRRVEALEVTAPETWLRVELRALAVWAAWLDGDVRAARHWAEQIRVRDDDDDLVARSNVALLDAWWPPSRDDAGAGP